MNKDDKNCHFGLKIIDISTHGTKEMGQVKMLGPGFEYDVYSMKTRFCHSKDPVLFRVRSHSFEY